MFLKISSSMGSRRGIFTEKSTGLGANLFPPGARSAIFLERNYVDNECNTPQYLVVREMPMQHLGYSLQLGPALTTLQGKIVHGGKLHASKEKGKEEKEALTIITSQEPESASREKHLPRGFFLSLPFPQQTNRKSAKIRLSRRLARARNASGEARFACRGPVISKI